MVIRLIQYYLVVLNFLFIDENYFPDKKAISSIDEYIKYLF